MRVSDVMQSQVDHVSTDTKLSEVAHLIFGRGINGVPVCKGKKVIGFITEKDILSRFYPSVREYMEDPVNESNFEQMEEKINHILTLPVEKIMSKHITTVTPETPLLKAQSMMFVHKVGRLPVVDKKHHLIGIISKGDIFKAIVGGGLRLGDEEKFYDWNSKFYDLLIDWEKRLKKEIPELTKLFNREKVKTVIDIGSSTGEHSITLAKAGFTVYGFEASSLICKIAEKKRILLSKEVQGRLKFIEGEYKDTLKKMPKGSVDAVIFMGNALPHVFQTDKEILKELGEILRPKKSLMVIQNVNLEKLFKTSTGLQDFSPDFVRDTKHAFIAFYTRTGRGTATYTRAVFESEGYQWIFRGLSSTNIAYLRKSDMEKMLKKLGFSKISFYGWEGSLFYGDLFKQVFKPNKSDLLNIVAER